MNQSHIEKIYSEFQAMNQIFFKFLSRVLTISAALAIVFYGVVNHSNNSIYLFEPFFWVSVVAITIPTTYGILEFSLDIFWLLSGSSFSPTHYPTTKLAIAFLISFIFHIFIYGLFYLSIEKAISN